MRSVLLVEDDPMVARMMTTALEMWGYTPLHAGTPHEALRLAEAHRDQIFLAICDVMLPEMSGTSVAANIRGLCPNAEICFTSGYTIDVLTQRGLLSEDDFADDSTVYLQKPFLPQALRDLVRQAAAESDWRAQAATKKVHYAAAH